MSATVTSVGGRITPSLAAPIACGCCLLAGAAYVTMNDPLDGGLFLPCPFRTLTGWWCPGCGLTRATHHLFRGEIVQALRYNLFVVVILVALAAAWAGWLVHTAGRSIRVPIPVWVPVAAGVTLLAFAVVRNLPGFDALRG
ncbi:MAG: DUF2752 domain-containing protein [Ilumatobacteraceae bacterium]